jgi:hypothetical protein
MASILRSILVIGAIALQSPVHEETADPKAAAPASVAAVQPRAVHAMRPEMAGPAAREALEILAGLDPETRERLIALAASAMQAGTKPTPH